MKNMIGRVGPTLRMLRYIKPQQVMSRLDYKTRALYYLSPFYGLMNKGTPVSRLALVPPELWPGDPKKGQLIARNTFTFIGRTVNMGEEVRWRPHEVPMLWLYNLHYFHWLADLKAMGPEGLTHARRLVEDWLLSCNHFSKDVWHPYPLSLRIVNWLTYAEWLTKDSSAPFKQHFFESLTFQVNHLEKCLEWDVGGNHLIKNLKALIFAGACLPGRKSVYLEALGHLIKQLKIQVLPDGAHYELSPHYHVDVLQDLLDIHAIIRKSRHTPPPKLDEAIDHMAQAFEFYRYPDGTLGLFNDGAVGDKKFLQALAKKCGRIEKPGPHLPFAGYVKMQKGDTMVMLDAAKVGPDELPAHAHADTLSFEMCVNKQRVVVNGGTFAYQTPLRDYFRSTAAHSTVEVGKRNSAEVFGAFRLGRRPQQVDAQVIEEKDMGIGAVASHDGYKYVGVTHKRSAFLNEEGTELRGEDVLEGRNGQPVMANFHLHPDVKCSLKSESQAELTLPDKTKISFKASGGRLTERESKYAPHFGEMIPTRRLVIQAKLQNNKCVLKWAFKKL